MKRNAYGKTLTNKETNEKLFIPNTIEFGADDNGGIRRTIDKKELKKMIKEEKLKIKFGEKYDPNYGK